MLRSVYKTPIIRYASKQVTRVQDELVVEEPLEIRVLAWEEGRLNAHSVAVTMRTPGDDFELAVGFLFTEGVISSREDVLDVAYCPSQDEAHSHNIVNVYLSPRVSFDPSRLSRNVYTSSSCGICGRATIESVYSVCKARPVGEFKVDARDIVKVAPRVREAQRVFSATGGLHATALLDPRLRLLEVKEDVGRHNSMDKLIGSLLLRGGIPASNKIVVVSGRAGFELVQKAALAGIPFLVSIGAPSSLAVELARNMGMTLVGFLRGDRFNVYSGEERIRF